MNARFLSIFVVLVLASRLFAVMPTTAPAVKESPVSVRVVVDVIEAVVDQNVLPQMDFQKIDPPRHRVDRLLSALSKNGQASLSARFDNSMTPGNEISLRTGQNCPIITGSNISSGTGNISHTIDYKEVGTNFRFVILSPPVAGSFSTRGTVDWSGLADSGIKISQDVNAPILLHTSMTISPVLSSDKPVLLSTMTKLPDRPAGKRSFQVVLFRIVANPSIDDAQATAPPVSAQKPSNAEDRQP